MAWAGVRTFYTDGACKGNPGPGGWAFVELDNIGKDLVGFNYVDNVPNTTNNRMELTAILAVCEVIRQSVPYEKDMTYIIYSDSAYCVNLINSWMWGWARNGWRTTKKEEIANKDLILNLYSFFDQFRGLVMLEKIPGHSSILGNEIADKLATGKKQEVKKLLAEAGYDVDYTCTGWLSGKLLLNEI